MEEVSMDWTHISEKSSMKMRREKNTEITIRNKDVEHVNLTESADIL
jgi:hypothetical protein